jgi:hypothetical protein
MDAETPARGRDKSGDLHTERGRFTRGILAGLDPGGWCPLHHDVGFGRPMTSPRPPMMSPNVLDVLEVVVCQVARMAGS